MSIGTHKWKRQLEEVASEFGGQLEHRSKHWSIILPNGQTASCSATPSDINALKQTRRLLRRLSVQTRSKGTPS